MIPLKRACITAGYASAYAGMYTGLCKKIMFLQTEIFSNENV